MECYQEMTKCEARTHTTHWIRVQHTQNMEECQSHSQTHKQKHRVDEQKLRRWSQTTLEGKDNQKTLIISTHYPC